MNCSEKLDYDFLAMTELTREISSIVQRTIDQNYEDLSPSDIEHILKMTSDVTLRMKLPLAELTV